MEIDFMGLGAKNYDVSSKDYRPNSNHNIHSARRGGSGMHLSKSVLANDVFNSNQISYTSTVQKNRSPDKLAGNRYAMTTNAQRHIDGYPSRSPHEMTAFPISKQQNRVNTAAANTQFLKQPFVSTGHGSVGNSINSQHFRGVSFTTAPASVNPTVNSVGGTTDLRNGSKSSGGPAQLTIFYSGSVCVYEDVPVEKAQAIMLLAGSGSPVGQNNGFYTNQAHTPTPKSSSCDNFVMNNNQPDLSLPMSSPMSLNNGFYTNQSHSPLPKPSACDSFVVSNNQPDIPLPMSSPVSHNNGFYTNQSHTPLPKPSACDSFVVSNNQPDLSLPMSSPLSQNNGFYTNQAHTPLPKLSACDSFIVFNTQPNHSSSSNLLNSISETSSSIPKNVSAGVLPQARKASVARFLEKRKERAMNISPYNIVSKTSSDCSSRIGSGREDVHQCFYRPLMQDGFSQIPRFFNAQVHRCT